MAIGIISIILLGIKRFEKIDAKLHSETKLAQLLGLRRFFDNTYARKFLQEFQLPHLKQLDAINTSLLREFGDASRQTIGIVDLAISLSIPWKAERGRKRSPVLIGRPLVNHVINGV